MTRCATRTLLALWVFLPAGCAPRHPPLPLDSPEESAAAAPDSAPAVGEEDAVTTIEEEPLPDEGRAAAAPSAGEPAADALAVDPPALAQTIDAGTAPNVAAATRLVDAGRARMAAADYGTALELLERAIAVDSENPYAYYYLAELHFIHHTYDQAIAFADRAAGLSEARAPDWASRAYTLQGNAFEAAGRFADARDAYTRAIEAAPGNLAAQVGLARVGSPAVPAP